MRSLTPRALFHRGQRAPDRIHSVTAAGWPLRDRRATASPRRKSGFSLLELVITIAVLVMGLMAISATVAGASILRHIDKERRLAETVLRSTVEAMRSYSRSSLSNPAGWSQTMVTDFSPGGAVGGTFDVPGLRAIPGQLTVGTIQVVVDERVTDKTLGVDLGMPRDLDADGVADNPNVSAKATMLPVVIRIQWMGTGGNRRLVHGFYVLGY
jgi:prepilin-type N-terminal cleavage/methylation domain-containing protein